MKNKLLFYISDNADAAGWSLPGTSLRSTDGGDFWRIIADDGYYMEMTVKSSQQKGSVVREGDTLTVTYDKLLTDTGRELDVTLTLTVKNTEEGLEFCSEINNRGDVRINELEYPYIDMNKLVGDRKDDVLIRPRGLGERMQNPWKALESAHTEYMSSDYNEIKSTLMYPRPATMTWMGVQSGEYFLYVGKHDARTHACCLLNAIQPREASEPRLVNAICQYPFAEKGECISPSPVVVSMFKGDWRDGSDIYSKFARSTYFSPVTPRKWVQSMTGWQRIILRHQYGEIFFKYADLPRLYLEGKRYGLDTLLVFGWWKGRFDNGYPHYEIDEELGGEQALKDAISEVQRLGGHVILYNNGILIDKNTQFYREHSSDAPKKDIDGNEYLMNYKFENNGTYLRNYGYKTFVEACQATEIWYKTLENNGKLKLSFDPDSIFYDQIGGVCRLCFNKEHKHGARPDDELHFRRENLDRLRAMLKDDQAIGTECTNDSVCGKVDYLHGCDFGNSYRATKTSPTKSHFPQMFRRTFPEIIMTNRFIHDCRTGWKDDLNHAFINGFRYDVALFRCRKIGIGSMPEYGEHLEKIFRLKEEYSRFFYDRNARYVCQTELDLPEEIKYCEYVNGSERMFALRNDSSKEVEFDILSKHIILEANGIACVTV